MHSGLQLMVNILSLVAKVGNFPVQLGQLACKTSGCLLLAESSARIGIGVAVPDLPLLQDRVYPSDLKAILLGEGLRYNLAGSGANGNIRFGFRPFTETVHGAIEAHPTLLTGLFCRSPRTARRYGGHAQLHDLLQVVPLAIRQQIHHLDGPG
jgi:hypothetical protein